MPIEELKDFNKYYTIQIWSHKDSSGKSLEKLANNVAKEIKLKNNANVLEIFGPTFLLSDFFSELYGKIAGYVIVAEKTVDPYDLKKTCMELETNSLGKRICDIDVYISSEKSIHRRDLLE